MLIIDKPGRVKRIRFYEGDLIHLKLKSKELVFGEITTLKDSSFFVGLKNIKLSDVYSIQNSKGNYGLRVLSKIMLPAGLMYLGIDSFNRLINEEGPIFREETLILSSSFLGVFFISNAISNRQLKINKKRSIRILDINI